MTMQLVVAACHCLPKRPTSWWYVCRCVRGWGCVVGVAVAYVQPWQALEGAATPAVGDVDTEATVGGDASADVDMLEPRLPTHDAAAASAQAREDTFQALPTAAEVVASQRETRDSRTGKRRIQPLLVWYARRVVCKWDGGVAVWRRVHSPGCLSVRPAMCFVTARLPSLPPRSEASASVQQWQQAVLPPRAAVLASAHQRPVGQRVRGCWRVRLMPCRC